MHLYLLLKALVLFLLFTDIASYSIQDDKLKNSFSITTISDAYRSMCVCGLFVCYCTFIHEWEKPKLIYNEKKKSEWGCQK